MPVEYYIRKYGMQYYPREIESVILRFSR